MAVAFRNAAATIGSAGANLVVNKPTGVVAGDVMVAFVQSQNGATVTPPTGWSVVDTSSVISVEFFRTYTKVAGGSEPTTYTWTSTGNLWAGSISAFSGVDNSTPVDGHNIGTTNVSPVVCPSVSPASTNCMLVFGCSDENGGTTSTFPGGSTEDIDTQVAGHGGIHVGHELLTASGATGTRSITMTAGDNTGMFTIALKAPSSPPSAPRVIGQAVRRASVM